MQKQNRFIENIACYTLNEAGNCLIGLIDLNGELRAFTINGTDARKIHRLRVQWENETGEAVKQELTHSELALSWV